MRRQPGGAAWSSRDGHGHAIPSLSEGRCWSSASGSCCREGARFSVTSERRPHRRPCALC
eukprot:813568-Pyramimonas_sp.AAC.1